MADARLLVLVSLLDGPKHGYAIQADVNSFAAVHLGPGTLYGALNSLERDGLVEALPSDQRRRPYRLTQVGRQQCAISSRNSIASVSARPRRSHETLALAPLSTAVPSPLRGRADELLDHSERPVRDALDVAVHAGQLRGQQLMTNAARHLADLVLAVALFTLGYAVNDLQDGVVEVHQHWWSSAAVLLVLAAAALRVTVAIAATKRPHKPPKAPS